VRLEAIRDLNFDPVDEAPTTDRELAFQIPRLILIVRQDEDL
jgi:hypothetical protein